MYEVGAKVVYPMHGVGLIQTIEEKNILDKKRQYYIMELFHTNMTVMIPVEMSDKVGLRGVVGMDVINEAYSILKSEATELDEDWKVRYSSNHGKIKSGSFVELAEVVRNLFIRNQIKELSNSEKRLFENALKLMVDEIAFSTETEKVEVEHVITETLEEGLSENKKLNKELEAKISG
ncbi:MAG: CarD family transcriptional regulator [Spirochaetota bacterium]|nr:CarD family transcriptional regulator [Spirochaetota bacterium]